MQAAMPRIRTVFLSSQVSFFFFFFPSPPPPPLYLMSTGIAVDKNGLIYFVDGTTIRKVDQNGIISTFLGSNDLTSARPLTCDNSMDINQVIYTRWGTRWWLTLCLCALMERITAPPSAPPAHLTLCAQP